MKTARARVRATPEQRLKQLQAQVEAAKKRAELKQTIAKARQDLKALKLSRR
jgi:hypothetical protein